MYAGGTTNLHSHLEASHPSTLYIKNKRKKQVVLSVSKKCLPGRENAINKLVTKFVARDIHLISTIDGVGFTQLLNYIDKFLRVKSPILKRRYFTVMEC